MLYASFELSKAALKERALREQLARAACAYYKIPYTRLIF